MDDREDWKPNFTQIPNIVFDYWQPRLKPSCFNVLIFLCRKIYGWGKSSDYISIAQFVKHTGISKRTIQSSLKNLISLGLVEKVSSKTELGDDDVNSYRLFICDSAQILHGGGANFAGGGRAKNSQGVGQKVATQKKDLQKKESNTSSCCRSSSTPRQRGDDKISFQKEEGEAYESAKAFFGFIRINDPTAKEPNFRAWAKDLDLLHRIDKRSWSDIISMMKWCQEDSFWKANILSPRKLREKWGQLTLKRRSIEESSCTSAAQNPNILKNQDYAARLKQHLIAERHNPDSFRLCSKTVLRTSDKETISFELPHKTFRDILCKWAGVTDDGE